MSPELKARQVAETTRMALEVTGLWHRYESEPVVRDVSFALPAGEVACLVGPSGCGKTTALRLVAGLEPAQRGSVVVGARTVSGPDAHVPPERRGVGMVFQDYALFPHLTARANVAFGLAGALGERARAADRVDQVLALVGMSDHADAYPHTLSGGQQQRIALARALAPDPAVLLLDEPFSGLDARLRDRVRDDTLHTLKEAGTATLMVTHDPEEAMFMADRIVVMRDGRVEQDGTPSDIYFTPVNAFVANFFSDTNVIQARVRGGAVVTPFGDLPSGGIADGAAAIVMVRPEALKLVQVRDSGAPPPGHVAARVAASRLLGRTCVVHLELEDERFGAHHMHSRVPGRFLPTEGTTIWVALDRSQAFVFAAEDGAGVVAGA